MSRLLVLLVVCLAAVSVRAQSSDATEGTWTADTTVETTSEIVTMSTTPPTTSFTPSSTSDPTTSTVTDTSTATAATMTQRETTQPAPESTTMGGHVTLSSSLVLLVGYTAALLLNRAL